MISIEQVALKYKIVIFDFDDTLVHEKDFLLLVYHQISSYVAHKYGINGKDIFLFLKDEFFRNGREKIFDKLIFKYNLDKDSISDFLHIMRTIEINPKLKIKPICNFFLNKLIFHDIGVYILTNGNYLQQVNKIKNTEWHGLEKQIFFMFADLHEPKPSKVCIDLIMKQTKVESSLILFIGDSDIDELTSQNAGIDFISINDIR